MQKQRTKQKGYASHFLAERCSATMICRAATHLSFCPPARNAGFLSKSYAGVQRQSVGKHASVCGEHGALNAREAQRRKNSFDCRYFLFWVRMSGKAAMTREAQGRSAVSKSSRVLVIGAGAAGLVAARELVREGLDVVVYEQSTQTGGVWVYSPETESDPLGVHPHRSRVHSSMYLNLRTNLPREIMGYLDYPFLPKQGRDERRFPGYEEVNLYLRDFAQHYNLLRLIEFGMEVEYVGIKGGKASVLSENKILRWIVRSRKGCNVNHEPEVREEIFDAVVICNGHYSEPKVVDIPGIESWPGLNMHSHSYRVPDPFKDKVVVIIGNGNSGGDISREVAEVAKQVHVCARNWPGDKLSVSAGGPRGNLWHHPLVERACEDGTVIFQDGSSTMADVIIQCTGYLFTFPFLDTQGVVSVEDGRVGPLYKHVFVPSFAPTLSFVGLPIKVVPFPLFEAQSKWISKVLSGKVKIPSVSAMMSDVKQFYEGLEAKGIPKYRTHTIAIEQFEYVDCLLEQCGEKPVEPWRKGMYFATGLNRMKNPEYRDDWKDQDLLNVARNSLKELSQRLCIEVS